MLELLYRRFFIDNDCKGFKDKFIENNNLGNLFINKIVENNYNIQSFAFNFDIDLEHIFNLTDGYTIPKEELDRISKILRITEEDYDLYKEKVLSKYDTAIKYFKKDYKFDVVDLNPEEIVFGLKLRLYTEDEIVKKLTDVYSYYDSLKESETMFTQEFEPDFIAELEPYFWYTLRTATGLTLDQVASEFNIDIKIISSLENTFEFENSNYNINRERYFYFLKDKLSNYKCTENLEFIDCKYKFFVRGLPVSEKYIENFVSQKERNKYKFVSNNDLTYYETIQSFIPRYRK